MGWNYYNSQTQADKSANFSFDTSRYLTDGSSLKYDPNNSDYVVAINDTEVTDNTSVMLRMRFYNPTYAECGSSTYRIGLHFGGRWSGGDYEYAGLMYYYRNNAIHSLHVGWFDNNGTPASLSNYNFSASPLSDSTWYGLELKTKKTNNTYTTSYGNQLEAKIYNSDFLSNLVSLSINYTFYNYNTFGFFLRNGSASGDQWIDSFEIYEPIE